MNRKLIASFLALVLAVSFPLFTVVPVGAATATVSTDKPDYAPGETVLITGQNFKPFGNITIKIIKPDLTTGLPGTEFDTATTMADQFGTFKYYYYLLDGRFGEYQVEASDGTNAATCTFYDTPTPYMYAEPEYTDGTSNTVSWKTPPKGAKSYEVQASTDSGFVTIIGTGYTVHPTAEYTFSGLTLGTKYYYRVRAFNKSDPLDPSAHPSDWSNVVFSTQGTAPSPDQYYPIAEAGGPYSGSENSPVALDASGSYDPDVDGYISTYEWDWDSDGIYDLITSSPTATHVWVDNGNYVVTLRVTDGASKTATDTATVGMANVAPTANAGPDQTTTVGATVSFTGSATDPGVLDTFTYSWDFDSSNGIQQDALGQSVTHVYNTAGTYTVTLTVTDKDGGVGTDTAVVTVNPTADTTPPAAVTNLAVSSTTSNSATLTWTAPGDDGTVGTASQYDIRYSTSAITDANWASATQATGEPLPQAAGSSETFTVTGLSSGITYYFALKTADEVPNWSGISNSPSGTTAASTIPSAPAGLAANPSDTAVLLTWNAVSGATGYKVYYGTASGTYGTPIDVGNTTSYVMYGLEVGKTYYVAVSAYDATTESPKSAEVTTALATTANTRYNEIGTAIVYTGTWETADYAQANGGHFKRSKTTGSTATFSFVGNKVVWRTIKAWNRGIAKVYVDGALEATVDLYDASLLWDQGVFSKDLAQGSHTIKVEVTGTKNASATDYWVDIDAFDVYGAPLSYDDNSNTVSWAGSWSTSKYNSSSDGGFHRSNSTGASATFTFTGTSVTWVAIKAWNRGMAKVYVDGIYETTVDLYSSNLEWFAKAFTKTGLPFGTHTLTIEVAGLKNASSTDYWVDVDCLDVSGGYVRYDDTNPNVTFTGTWGAANYLEASGDSFSRSNTAGSTVTFTFTGSAVKWVTITAYNRGKAEVYIDGVLDATVDLYTSDVRWQQEVYSKSGLAYGAHTIMVKVTGTKNASATDYWVDIDAFDVL